MTWVARLYLGRTSGSLFTEIEGWGVGISKLNFGKEYAEARRSTNEAKPSEYFDEAEAYSVGVGRRAPAKGVSAS